VSQALSNRCWVSDIKGALTVQVLIEYLHIWELLEGVIIQPDTPDTPGFHLRAAIAANQHMKLCSLAISISPLGSAYGRLGLREIESYLFGWALITSAGPQIAWPK